jgi:hypothetical protein
LLISEVLHCYAYISEVATVRSLLPALYLHTFYPVVYITVVISDFETFCNGATSLDAICISAVFTAAQAKRIFI